MTKDENGRITALQSRDEFGGFPVGPSVCAACGCERHRIWDTVCFTCLRIFCYDCLFLQVDLPDGQVETVML